MFIWCAILFLLGVSAFMDSMFNYGEIFRQVNSVLFMLVSLGLLIRTTIKVRAQVIERQVQRISELEAQLAGHAEHVREVNASSPSAPVAG